MKRKRPDFILEHEAGSIRRERSKSWPQAIECCRALTVDHAIENSVGAASFEPVQTRCGALPRLEQLVELGERAAADQGKRSLAPGRKPNDQRGQAVWYSNKFRTGSDLEQRPVHIEKPSRPRVEWRRRQRFGDRQRGGFVHCPIPRRRTSAQCLD